MLTERERDILRRLTTLNRPADIARELNLSDETVRTHIKNARRKLGNIGQFEAARLVVAAEGLPQNLGNHPLAIPSRPIGWRDLLPVRRKGAIGNDFSLALRLFWIPALAALFGVAFAVFAGGVRDVADLLRAIVQ